MYLHVPYPRLERHSSPRRANAHAESGAPRRRLQAHRHSARVRGPSHRSARRRSRSISTTTTRATRSSSRSIRISPKDRVAGLAQNSPIRAARSKSGSIRTWSSSARAAGGSASRRRRRRSSSSGIVARRKASPGGFGPRCLTGPLGASRASDPRRARRELALVGTPKSAWRRLTAEREGPRVSLLAASGPTFTSASRRRQPNGPTTCGL
jgi:hypothetical protein